MPAKRGREQLKSSTRIIRFLYLGKDWNDAEPIAPCLEKEWPGCVVRRVTSRDRYKAALEAANFDLILAEDDRSDRDGLHILELVRCAGLDKPVIVLGASVGEERVAELWRHGASDFVLKKHPERMVSSIQRVLDEAAQKFSTTSSEDALREAKAQINEQAALLDKAQDAIVVQNLDGTITYWNQGAKRLYGWSSEEIVGRNVSTFLTTDPGRSQFARHHTCAHGEWRGELRQRTKEGHEVTVQSSWTLVRDEAEKPKAFLVINTDVTENRMLESKFLRAQRMESMGMMVGGIAHDLNNMLAPILMAVDVLQRMETNPEAQDLIGTMRRSAVNGAALVQQLLAFARGAEGQHEEVDLRPLLTEFVEFMGKTLKGEARLKISFKKLPPPVKVDVTQIKQVLMNLCINARDAMPHGGEIAITVDRVEIDEAQAQALAGGAAGSYAVMNVADTGEGISAEDMERIFDPFFTTKETNRGTGLGLVTVRGIVKGHGGFLTVDSVPGQGTTFHIYLPVNGGGRNSGSSGTPFAPAILLVDDEEMVRNTLSLLLKSEGYRVYAAEDGIKALEHLRARRGDIKLMISDLRMSGMDGCELIETARQENPNLPLIALTNSPVVKDKVRLEKAQARLLAKPMTRTILLEAVSDALEAAAK